MAEAVIIVLLSLFVAPGWLMLLVPVPPLTLVAAILLARYASSHVRPGDTFVDRDQEPADIAAPEDRAGENGSEKNGSEKLSDLIDPLIVYVVSGAILSFLLLYFFLPAESDEPNSLSGKTLTLFHDIFPHFIVIGLVFIVSYIALRRINRRLKQEETAELARLISYESIKETRELKEIINTSMEEMQKHFDSATRTQAESLLDSLQSLLDREYFDSATQAQAEILLVRLQSLLFNTYSDLKQLEIFDRFGLDSVYEMINEANIGELMGEAKEICILNTWFNVPGDGECARIFREIANKEDCSIKILLLNPDSPFTAQRSEDLGGTNVKRLIEERKEFLEQLKERYDIKNLEVRYYDALPSVPLYIIDDYALFGFFSHIEWADDLFWFGIKTKNLEGNDKSLLGKFFHEEFERVWDNFSWEP